MSQVLQLPKTFVIEECCNCGISFAMTSGVQRQRKEDGGSFWCPNGHSQHYTETEIVKLRKEIEQQKKRIEWAEESRNRANERAEKSYRQFNGMKGAMAALKNRIGNGVCPCCKRSFENLQRHMKTKHPKFKEAINNPQT